MCAIRRRIDGLNTTKELNAENAENAEKKLKLKKLGGLSVRSPKDCELGGKKRRKLGIEPEQALAVGFAVLVHVNSALCLLYYLNCLWYVLQFRDFE